MPTPLNLAVYLAAVDVTVPQLQPHFAALDPDQGMQKTSIAVCELCGQTGVLRYIVDVATDVLNARLGDRTDDAAGLQSLPEVCLRCRSEGWCSVASRRGMSLHGKGRCHVMHSPEQHSGCP